MINQNRTLSAYVQPSSSELPAAIQASEPILDRSDGTLDLKLFYEWIGERCLVSPLVAGNVARLWGSYERFCRQAGAPAEKFAFTQAIATEFHVLGGLADGVCLLADSAAFGKAYPEQWRQSAVTAYRLRRKGQCSPIDHPGIVNAATDDAARLEAA